MEAKTAEAEKKREGEKSARVKAEKINEKLQSEWIKKTSMVIEDASYCANPNCDYNNKQTIAESVIQINYVSIFTYLIY